MMITQRLISFLIGYVCGLFLMGFFLGKIKHVDITKAGSGNVGTTNATRVLGVKSGILTLLCDILKGFAAAFIVWMLYRGAYEEQSVRVLASYAAFGAMIGHMFPFYMGFKGGKGVATSLSFMAVCVPQVMPLCVATFIVTVLLTKYVSLGSVLGTVVVIIEVIVFGTRGMLFYEGAQLVDMARLVCIAAAIVIVKHHANIGRLLRGEENKLSFHKG